VQEGGELTIQLAYGTVGPLAVGIHFAPPLAQRTDRDVETASCFRLRETQVGSHIVQGAVLLLGARPSFHDYQTGSRCRRHCSSSSSGAHAAYQRGELIARCRHCDRR